MGSRGTLGAREKQEGVLRIQVSGTRIMPITRTTNMTDATMISTVLLAFDGDNVAVFAAEDVVLSAGIMSELISV